MLIYAYVVHLFQYWWLISVFVGWTDLSHKTTKYGCTCKVTLCKQITKQTIMDQVWNKDNPYPTSLCYFLIKCISKCGTLNLWPWIQSNISSHQPHCYCVWPPLPEYTVLCFGLLSPLFHTDTQTHISY